MLQALNILENFDLKSMGYNSARYIHTVYQAMSLAFADRDFYYGDPAFPPEEPIAGLLSKEYAKRAREADRIRERNDPTPSGPAIRIRSRAATNPYRGSCCTSARRSLPEVSADADLPRRRIPSTDSFYAGTTSVEAADEEGWVVSVTPSGGWIPAVIAGKTGVGLSQRAQSFVTDPRRESVQRHRARQAPARHAHADARDEGRQAVPRLRRAGRRHAGPEPAAVLPQRRRVRHDACRRRPRRRTSTATRCATRSASTRSVPGQDHCSTTRSPTGCAATCAAWATSRTFDDAHLRPDQRDHVDPRSTARSGAASSNHGEDYGIAW